MKRENIQNTADLLLSITVGGITFEDIIRTWITASGAPRIKAEKILVRLSSENKLGRENVMRAIAYVGNHM